MLDKGADAGFLVNSGMHGEPHASPRAHGLGPTVGVVQEVSQLYPDRWEKLKCPFGSSP